MDGDGKRLAERVLANIAEVIVCILEPKPQGSILKFHFLLEFDF